MVGAAIATVTILDHVINPAIRVVRHEHQATQFAKLQTEARKLELGEFEIRLEEVRAADDVNGLEFLRYVAYNDMVQSAEWDKLSYQLSPWQRLIALLV